MALYLSSLEGDQGSAPVPLPPCFVIFAFFQSFLYICTFHLILHCNADPLLLVALFFLGLEFLFSI